MSATQGLRAYYASGLFNEGERSFNLRVKAMLDELGFETWFPQEDAGFLEDYMEKGMTLDEARHFIFEQNLEAVRASDVLIFNLDGRVPDEGACIEAGVAFGWDKRLIGLQTDFRAVEPGGNNLMIDGVLNYEIARGIDELRRMLTETAMSVDLRGSTPSLDLTAVDHRYVAVTGPLGAGKTTLMGIMEEHGGWQTLDEPNDENPYLEDVYANPEDLAFRMQVYYLAKRGQQHHMVHSIDGRNVQERCILDDGEVFFPANHAAGAYSEKDLKTLLDMYRGLLPGLELPDRIIAVDAPFEVCLNRIASRGRGGEEHLDRALALAIYDGYHRWWDTLGEDVIWIDSGGLNLAENPEDRAAALRTVHEALQQTTDSAEVAST